MKTIPSVSSLTASAVTLSPFFKENENLSPTLYFLLFSFVALCVISIVTFVGSSTFTLQPIEKPFASSCNLRKPCADAVVETSSTSSEDPVYGTPSNPTKQSFSSESVTYIFPVFLFLNNFIVYSPLFMFDYNLFLRCGRIYLPYTAQIFF